MPTIGIMALLSMNIAVADNSAGAPINSKSNELQPFTSDGCSAFPNGTVKEQRLWLDCCYQHDLTYWQGGTFKQRYAADIELKQCVAKVGEPEIANLMLAGVRVGGSPYLPTPFRWGYGWPFPRGYKALDENEKKLLAIQLEALEVSPTQTKDAKK